MLKNAKVAKKFLPYIQIFEGIDRIWASTFEIRDIPYGGDIFEERFRLQAMLKNHYFVIILSYFEQ